VLSKIFLSLPTLDDESFPGSNHGKNGIQDDPAKLVVGKYPMQHGQRFTAAMRKFDR
jgi:hypothetical protein